MNCKPGDLAVFIKSTCGNEGKIVTCIRLLGYHEHNLVDRVVWLTAEQTIDQHGRSTPYAPDEFLRPIRPNDGEDEIIRIAGKPHDAHKSTPETA